MTERELFEPESAPLSYRGAEFVVRVLTIEAGSRMASATTKALREAHLLSEALFWPCGVKVFASARDVLRLPATRADLIDLVKAKLAEITGSAQSGPGFTEAAGSPEEVKAAKQ